MDQKAFIKKVSELFDRDCNHQQMRCYGAIRHFTEMEKVTFICHLWELFSAEITDPLALSLARQKWEEEYQAALEAAENWREILSRLNRLEKKEPAAELPAGSNPKEQATAAILAPWAL